MENVIDIRMALGQRGGGWQFGGSVTAGTEEAWDSVVWEDERPKPSWTDLCAAHSVYVISAASASLRTARDMRLDATDKYLLADCPITAKKLAAVKAYRQALRDLPEQPGAPWDGGGELTPWPIKPV